MTRNTVHIIREWDPVAVKVVGKSLCGISHFNRQNCCDLVNDLVSNPIDDDSEKLCGNCERTKAYGMLLLSILE